MLIVVNILGFGLNYPSQNYNKSPLNLWWGKIFGMAMMYHRTEALNYVNPFYLKTQNRVTRIIPAPINLLPEIIQQ